MAVLQLVSQERPQGLEELSVIPNPTERRPASFETLTTHPALIGSQDLAMLAAGLCRQGYRATHAVLSDRYFISLPDEESEDLLMALLAKINDADVQALDWMLRRELLGLYIQSVRLLGREGKGALSIRQKGIIIASPQIDNQALNVDLQNAASWAELG